MKMFWRQKAIRKRKKSNDDGATSGNNVNGMKLNTIIYMC
jgi:hypothetical protein